MYEENDNLPDSFWTENELNTMAELVINPPRCCIKPKHICWLHICKNDEWTGKSMVLAVESIVDGLNAVNRLLLPVQLSAQLGEYGNESVLNNWKIEAIYRVLDPYKYIGTAKFAGSDKVFTYETWMIKLI